MTQSRQTTFDRNFGTTRGNTQEGGSIDMATFLSIAESAVRRAVESSHFSPSLSNGVTTETMTKDPKTTSSGPSNQGLADLVVNLPQRTWPQRRIPSFHAQQEWEGYVIKIEDDTFVAHLVDITAGESYESLEAIVPLENLSEHDATNMEIDSVFRWVIGQEVSPEGARRSMSRIVLRDLPRITADDIRAGKKWAREMTVALNP